MQRMSKGEARGQTMRCRSAQEACRARARIRRTAGLLLVSPSVFERIRGLPKRVQSPSPALPSPAQPFPLYTPSPHSGVPPGVEHEAVRGGGEVQGHAWGQKQGVGWGVHVFREKGVCSED